MKLFELLKSVNLSEVYRYLAEKDNSDENSSKNAYSKVVEKLISFTEVSTKTKILVNYKIDLMLDYLKNNPDKRTQYDSTDIEDYKYIDVSLTNPNFEHLPDYSLKPWGGSSDSKNDCPDGYYNVNYDGYQKFFAVGNVNWGEFSNMEVVSEIGVPDHVIAAEILWELTFYGFSEKDQDEFWDGLKKSTQKMKEEIKNNK